jgi:hypothetical protein
MCWGIPLSRTLEAEAGGSQVHSQPRLHSEFQARLAWIARPCLKEKKRLDLKGLQTPCFVCVYTYVYMFMYI